jgi:hypothetical protein
MDTEKCTDVHRLMKYSTLNLILNLHTLVSFTRIIEIAKKKMSFDRKWSTKFCNSYIVL